MPTYQFVDNNTAVDVVDEQGTIIMRAYDQGENTALCRAPTKAEPERLIGQMSLVGRDDIQVSVPGSPLALRKGAFLSRDYYVDGPGYSWTWSRALQDNFTLSDASSGIVIAKYSRGRLSSTSILDLHQNLDDQQFEALILTALAMTERRDVHKRKVIKTSVITAAI